MAKRCSDFAVFPPLKTQPIRIKIQVLLKMTTRIETTISPKRQTGMLWKELWDYRDLFYFLAWRDLKVRYKQTVIGVAWAVLRPLITMAIFAVLFGMIAKLPTQGNTPYPILVFSAMLPWYFFSSTLQDSSQSLINHANMLSKVYFPRIIMPVSTMLVHAVDFAIALGLLFALFAIYRHVPTITLLALPVFILQVMMVSIGLGLWLAALNVSYRDVRYVVPFLLQIGLYISPVGFSSAIIPEEWRLVYALNPMVGVIDGFRWSLLGESVPFHVYSYLASVATGFFFFISGLSYFNRTEREFADII